MLSLFTYLVIRGMCDYSDSHKKKEWGGCEGEPGPGEKDLAHPVERLKAQIDVQKRERLDLRNLLASRLIFVCFMRVSLRNVVTGLCSHSAHGKYHRDTSRRYTTPSRDFHLTNVILQAFELIVAVYCHVRVSIRGNLTSFGSPRRWVRATSLI